MIPKDPVLTKRRALCHVLSCSSLLIILSPACSKNAPAPPAAPAELAKASRVDTNGWINVHLEGTPREIGFQHGWLLASEIDDLLKALDSLPRGLDEARLGVLPGLRRADVLAQARARVPGGDRGHRGRPSGPPPPLRLRPHRHHGPQRLDRARLVLCPLSRRDGQEGRRRQQGPRLLQRLHRHGELDGGRRDRRRPQQLGRLHRRLALERHRRHRPGDGPPHPDGLACRGPSTAATTSS